MEGRGAMVPDLSMPQPEKLGKVQRESVTMSEAVLFNSICMLRLQPFRQVQPSFPLHDEPDRDRISICRTALQCSSKTAS